MSDPTDEKVQLDAIIAQYRAELERSNYIRQTINVYLRSIRKLFRVMEEHGVALSDLTPDVAANLVRRSPWRSLKITNVKQGVTVRPGRLRPQLRPPLSRCLAG